MALLGQSAYTSGPLALSKCLVMRCINAEEMQSVNLRDSCAAILTTTQIIRR